MREEVAMALAEETRSGTFEVRQEGCFADSVDRLYAQLLAEHWLRECRRGMPPLTPKGLKILQYLQLRLARRRQGAGRWG